MGSGKFFSILGDSISTLQGYHPPGYAVFYQGAVSRVARVLRFADTWWGMVIDALGGELLVNNSWSGSLVCRHPDCQIPSYGCSDERTSALGRDGVDPDIIMVFMGINDCGWQMQLEPQSADEEGDIAIFRVAYADMLAKLRRNYPAAEIWCIAPGKAEWRGATEPPSPALRGSIFDYARIIRMCAAQAGCRALESSHTPGLSPHTLDGLHPDREGMEAIAKSVLRSLEADE